MNCEECSLVSQLCDGFENSYAYICPTGLNLFLRRRRSCVALFLTTSVESSCKFMFLSCSDVNIEVAREFIGYSFKPLYKKKNNKKKNKNEKIKMKKKK